ncbi:hypothetical protein NLI96_g10342 [Meripilus lineatus]|uniref:Peptidase A1 domain-containing protein n=1 Tax=Meripilus lineatus TaxID=2056292 RepID=A0AAD5UTT6_9APHY|nr:hypothetical protein NLI96_g10342 [Physisporinus lineatus]
MGCIPSSQRKSSAPETKPAQPTQPTETNEMPESQHKLLHKLIRPARYSEGAERPSFSAAYARAARRYGFETGQYAGFAKRNNLVVKVKGIDNKETEHEVPADGIQNGTPGITLNLDFDTGSSDLWVWRYGISLASTWNPSNPGDIPSTEFARASRYPGHHVFDPSKSSTAKKATGTWNISYGDGSSASGNVYTDSVKIGDIVVPGQAVELASKLSSSFLQDNGNDGLLGLAWPTINTVHPHGVKTPVENMIEKNLIDLPLFTVKLTRGDEPGFYSFGYIDPNVTSDAITYTTVDNSQGFWQVPSETYTINGSNLDRSGNTTILDTGTTLCLVADSVVEAIYKSIKGAEYDNQEGGWKYPSGAQVPEVAFAVGDKLYKINSEDFGFGPADEGYIFGGIQSRGDLDFDIFGDVFLKSVYVVFNQGEKTVGLAQRDD